MRRFICLLLLVSLAFSCRKEKASIPNSGCNCSIETSGSSTFVTKGLQFKSPYFNPNNPNEFVYNFINYTTNTKELRTYNTQTKQTKVLCNNVQLYSQPKWNKKGWITFDNVHNSNNQIWTIKDNGDSLTQVSNNTNSFFPVWDSSGNNVIWHFSPTFGYPYYIIKMNLQTLKKDTIFNDFTAYSDISSNNLLVSKISVGASNYLAYSPISTINFSRVIDIGFSTVEGLSWHPNNKDFYYTDFYAGLKKGNINQSTSCLLIKNCGCVNYKTLSCASDGTKIVVEKISSYPESDGSGGYTNNILQYSNIYMIDLVTLEETKIDL